MRRTDPQGHGPVRYGPPFPGDGLPVLPELAAVLAAAAGRPDAEPTGGGPALLDAACGYWARRGLPAEPDQVAARARRPRPAARADRRDRRRRPGAPALRGLVGASGAGAGQIRVPRGHPGRVRGRARTRTPCWRPYAGCAPRAAIPGCSYCPWPTTRRPPWHRPNSCTRPSRPPPEKGSTWSATRPGATPCTGPTTPCCSARPRCCPDRVTVVTDLCGALLPSGWPAALARFPANADGDALRARVLDVLTALGARIAEPVAAAAGYALGEPEPVTERLTAAVRLHARVATAVHRAVVAAGCPGPATAGRAAICTSISAPCGPRSAPTVSATPRNWRTTSPPGSGCPRRAVTGSGTTSRHCASGWTRARCSATRPRNEHSRSHHPNHWNCHMCEAR